MKPVGSQETEHAKGNTLFWCFKHWKPRQNAKIEIKMKQMHSLNFFTIQFQHVSDWQECDEEVKDASTC
jgi:hypothetical protein